jgi:cation diffusion facilitator family transporter
VVFLLTGSVALLSDAAESIVNVVAAVAVIVAMRYALRPADYEHPYGHAKAEYLSSVLEGGLILLAAGMILLSSIQRLLSPQSIENAVTGVVVALAASVVNGLLVWLLYQDAKRHQFAYQCQAFTYRCMDLRWCHIGCGFGFINWLGTVRPAYCDAG